MAITLFREPWLFPSVTCDTVESCNQEIVNSNEVTYDLYKVTLIEMIEGDSLHGRTFSRELGWR